MYNRTPEKALAWVALVRQPRAPTPREAAEGAEFVIMCVGNDNDVRDVVLGTTVHSPALEPGAVLVDHTTASAEVARELAEAAPSSGSASSTLRCRVDRPAPRTAQLTIMCGGDDEACFERPSR